MTADITQERATADLAGAGTIPLTPSDDVAAAGMLMRAFHADPMFVYIEPDESRRDQRVQPSFTAIFPYCRRYGIAERTATGDGVAMWLKPGFTTISMGRMLRTGALFSLRCFGFAGFVRFNALSSYGDTLHKQAMAGDHWYLLTIGVEPGRQGTGIGSRLLSAGLRRAEADGLPCYLETANPDNLPFYRRHGFEVVAEGQVPKSELHVWAMVRR